MPASAPPGAGLRCFVALLPGPAARARLDALARTLQRAHPQARRLTAANLHLTLAFVGACPAQRASRIAAALAALPVHEFTWTLDHVGGFARARVAWAGGPPDPRLDALAARVRKALDALGVRYDGQDFAPHVTLLRGVAGIAARPIARPIDWPSGAPVLMRSDRDARGAVRYRPVNPPRGRRER
jgi:2'-5' RNA ligase